MPMIGGVGPKREGLSSGEEYHTLIQATASDIRGDNVHKTLCTPWTFAHILCTAHGKNSEIV
jgi:hypothetical protein